jgi:hypothetical protein
LPPDRVILAEDRKEALMKFEKEPPDVVIMEIRSQEWMASRFDFS